MPRSRRPAPWGSAAIDGTAVIKNSNGDTLDRRGHGRRARERRQRQDHHRPGARAAVAAKTANGDVRLGEVARGAVLAESAIGTIDVGIRDGVAAWLDLNTKFGNVHNDLQAADRPEPDEETVEVRARTSYRRHHDPPLAPNDAGRMSHDHHDTAPAIAATGLRKSFGDKVVLDGIDLSVAEGPIFALLGPNGAGKTTTVQILSTLIARRRRRGARRGPRRRPATRTRSATSIGVTGQFSAVDNLLTGEENLALMADLRHLGRREGQAARRRAARAVRPGRGGRKPAATYSGGMRRRLDLAMTLVGDPRIIFLDEPTTGLDPRSRRAVWQIVRDLVAGGVTIFLTTQYLEEADQLADRIAVLDHGRLIAEGTPTSSSACVPGGHIRLRFADAGGPRRGRRAPLGGVDPRRRRADPAGPERRRRRLAARRCSTGSTRASIQAESCPCTRPTSTTSSSPSPADPTGRSDRADEHPCRTPCSDSDDDAAAQPPAHAALPVHDAAASSGSRSSSCCCSSTSSAARSAPGSAAPPAAAPTYVNYVTPGSS